MQECKIRKNILELLEDSQNTIMEIYCDGLCELLDKQKQIKDDTLLQNLFMLYLNMFGHMMEETQGFEFENLSSYQKKIFIKLIIRGLALVKTEKFYIDKVHMVEKDIIETINEIIEFLTKITGYRRENIIKLFNQYVVNITKNMQDN